MKHPYIELTAAQADTLFLCDEDGNNIGTGSNMEALLREHFDAPELKLGDVAFVAPNVFDYGNTVTRPMWCEIGEYNDCTAYLVATATWTGRTVEFLFDADNAE
jgi:hypothetical protein